MWGGSHGEPLGEGSAFPLVTASVARAYFSGFRATFGIKVHALNGAPFSPDSAPNCIISLQSAPKRPQWDPGVAWDTQIAFKWSPRDPKESPKWRVLGGAFDGSGGYCFRDV